jgi:hypothetical protein
LPFLKVLTNCRAQWIAAVSRNYKQNSGRRRGNSNRDEKQEIKPRMKIMIRHPRMIIRQRCKICLGTAETCYSTKWFAKNATRKAWSYSKHSGILSSTDMYDN